MRAFVNGFVGGPVGYLRFEKGKIERGPIYENKSPWRRFRGGLSLKTMNNNGEHADRRAASVSLLTGLNCPQEKKSETRFLEVIVEGKLGRAPRSAARRRTAALSGSTKHREQLAEGTKMLTLNLPSWLINNYDPRAYLRHRYPGSHSIYLKDERLFNCARYRLSPAGAIHLRAGLRITHLD